MELSDRRFKELRLHSEWRRGCSEGVRKSAEERNEGSNHNLLHHRAPEQGSAEPTECEAARSEKSQFDPFVYKFCSFIAVQVSQALNRKSVGRVQI